VEKANEITSLRPRCSDTPGRHLKTFPGVRSFVRQLADKAGVVRPMCLRELRGRVIVEG
jgi:hypothetical protein